MIDGNDQTEELNLLGPIWHALSGPLRRNADWIDLETVRPEWSTGSLQRPLMHRILQEAGFHQDQGRYFWS